jgi:mannosyltransferase OCH1-like enzyme
MAKTTKSNPGLDKDKLKMDAYPTGFEENDNLRSAFIRVLTLEQLDRAATQTASGQNQAEAVPRTLIRYWHDPRDVPDDVRACLDSWNPLREEGFEFRMFSDVSAAAYIAERYSTREREAFARCRHPAMRSDYLRMCFVLAEGGLYVDADDVLRGNGWRDIFRSGGLKVQPLCYDIPTGGMVPATEIWRTDLPTNGRIFYVNNDPIAAPAAHPVLRRALDRATERLLGEDPLPEIQSTTGPGNLTAALAAHARNSKVAGVSFDFELLYDWEAVAETRWELSYRNDARNWRNMDTC